MLTKNDFTVADWNTLRDAQYLVGLATLVAESSGLGTIKESIALAQGIVGNQASEYPFIRDMTSKTEMEAAQASLRQRFGGAEAKPSKDALQQTALEQVRASMSILKRQGEHCRIGRLFQAAVRTGGDGGERLDGGRIPGLRRKARERRRAELPGQIARDASSGARQ